jgi:predicted nucleotide-binding protein (sugar kinase/HSP70/actin superfamily)
MNTGSSSSSNGLTNIVSPAYDKSNINFLEAYSFDMNYDEEMHFPILDDDDDDNNDEHYYKEFKTISRIKEDNNSKKKKKKKNKHHYSELITTSAEGIHFVRLLMKYQVGDDWRREGV